MANFYILTIDRIENVDGKELLKILNKATNWQKMSSGVYIIKSIAEIGIWHNYFKEIAKKYDLAYFLCELNISNKKGWLKQSKWDWFDEAEN